MDAFIQQGVDVVLISAVDTDGIGPVVKRAVDAGIVVVALDVDAVNAQAVVMADNTEAGKMACSALADKIGGAGNIMIVDGTQVSSVQDRVTGCLDVLKSDYPDVTVVAQQAGKNDVGSGQQIATDMLTANKDVQGIFGINDPTARGAVLALEQAGRDGVWVVGVDGSPEGATAMKDGGAFWASATQDPGQQAVTAFGLAEQIAAGDPPADRVTRLAPTLVTQDDVADYTGWVVE
jgi:ribose transport system substrate-binding protein